jgi:hypothetical protein
LWTRRRSPGSLSTAGRRWPELVATDEFERVGAFKEVMDWSAYVDFLTNWATSSEWECSLRRVTEPPGAVFLELEERSRIGEFDNIVNSLSVYEFTDAGKIRHIDLYLQMAFPLAEKLKSFEVVQISE